MNNLDELTTPNADASAFQIVVGNSQRLPVGLVLNATELAQARQVDGLAEAHLLSATLRTPRLVRLLDGLNAPTSAIQDFFESRLDIQGPPNFEVVERPDGVEVYRYGVVDAIEGRAAVLAAMPDQHQVDAVDVFVAAMFDPKSLTTRAVLTTHGLSRDRLLSEISQSLGRYRGVSFPSARLATVGPPMRIGWAMRDEVVQLLNESVPKGVFWTYSKDHEDMLIFAEGTAVSDVLSGRGLIA